MAERSFHRVLRRVPGHDAEIGEIVDTTSWTSALALEHLQYLKACDAPQPAVVFREEIAEGAEPDLAATPIKRSKPKTRKGGDQA